MKVNNCNFYTPKILNNNKLPQKQNINNVGFDYSFSEAVGRSQVNFTANNSHKDYDRKFIDNISNQLSFSSEDKVKFENSVRKYLKENDFVSVKSIFGLNDAEQVDAFIETVGYEMNMSEEDFDNFSNKIIDAAMLDCVLDLIKQDDAFANLAFEVTFDYLKDYEMWERMQKEFELEPQEEKNILSQLKRRRFENIKPEQLAYEFIEKYDLGYKDYKFIVKTIDDVDKNYMPDINELLL